MTQQQSSSIFLGTAGWGKKVTKVEAYQIVETFYGNGFRWIDTATNYPIDQNPQNYGQTINWLSDFCSQMPELKIFIKAGSATNLGESQQLINESYFTLMYDTLIGKFGKCFGGLAIHWDDGTGASDRIATVDFLASLQSSGFEVGLSGIAKPELYSKHSLSRNLPWIYQANMSPTRSGKVRKELIGIRDNFPSAKIFAYNLLGGAAGKGMMSGGDRLSVLRKSPIEQRFNTESGVLDQVISRALSHNVDGLIIGPTTSAQCSEWCTTLDRFSLV